MTRSLIHLVFVIEWLIVEHNEKMHRDECFCQNKGVTTGKSTTIFKTSFLLCHFPENIDSGLDVGGFKEFN